MIELSNKKRRPFVREIWKECFGDSEEYMDLFFSEKYKDENTLVAIQENKVVAALQMLPYEITFYGKKIPFYYLAGLSTLPPFRNRGLMAKLIEKAHILMSERHIPLSILIPAEESLFAYYERFGYAQTFQKSESGFEVSIRKIWETSSNEQEAYLLFDRYYNQRDFCVQKSFSDFKTIIREEIYEDFPQKNNLWGVARIIDASFLLNSYAKANPTKKFTVCIQDKLFGEKKIAIENGQTQSILANQTTDFHVNERQLAQLLFGFETDLMQEPFSSLFPTQHPQMNYMLE